MLGSDAGRTTARNNWEPLQPSISAASNRRGSTDFTPKIVFSRIG
jgi:hypothetical protein